MLKLRLSRVGKNKQPEFRLLVSDQQKDLWGTFLENLGHYNPRTKKNTFNVDKIKEYISKGAQPSDTVHNLLVGMGVIAAKKRTATHMTKKRAKDLEDTKAKAKAEAEKAAADKIAKEEAEKAAAAEAKAKAEAEAAAAAAQPAPEAAPAETPAEPAPAEPAKEETQA